MTYYMRFLSLCAFGLMVFAAPSSAMQKTKAKQALVMDYQTGQVLFSKQADTQMPTSSMSKVMTTYMVFDALKNKQIEMDSKFRVSEKAWAKGGSKMFVGQGSKIKVEDLLRGVIIQSGNDATIVLAEGLSGSEEKFAKEMTKKALEIGMENSNFVNASGWPDPQHYSTAQDLVVMTRRMIEDFSEYYKMFAEKEFTYSNIKQQNRNPLLYRDVGADGLKTGHTEVGGYGLIGTAQKDGRRVIMVINGLESDKDRANESVRLIEWALEDFTNISFIKKGQAVTQAPVAMGAVDTVSLTVAKDINITVPKVPKDSFSVEVTYNTPLIAPIAAGTQIGEMKIIIPNAENLTYPVVAAEDVNKLGLFKSTFVKAKYFLLGKI